MSSGQSSAEQASVKEILEELDTFEVEMGVLLDDLSKVDASIFEFRDRCDDIAEGISNLGEALAVSAGGDSGKVKGLSGIASVAVKGFGWCLSAYRQDKARQEYQAKRDAVLQKKRIIAEEKLPVQTRQYDKLRSQVGTRIEALYSQDWNKRIDVSDPLLLSQVKIFRMNLSFLMRYRFLSAVLNYCIEEMRAWTNGKQDSGLPYPSMCDLLASEFGTWPERLGCRDNGWDGMMSAAVAQSQGEMPLPVLMVLSDPCPMRNFVGVGIGESDNCPDALIKLDSPDYHCANPIADGNLYLEHCRNVYAKDYHSLKAAPRFGLLDLLILLVPPVAFFGVLCLIFSLEYSAFWRIFFIFPALCWLGLGIDYYSDHYDDIFPYVKRIKAYNSEIEEFREMIISKEDCKEFHILG